MKNNRVSHSKIDTYWTCPYLYKLRYLDKLKTKPDTSPSNALYMGTALHEAIEKRDKKCGLDSYKKNYSNIELAHEIEMYKLERAMDKAIKEIPEGIYEYKLITDDFIGFIDMLVPVEEGVYDLMDFKFSNSSYKESGQVHLYTYYYQKLTGNKIRNIYYVMIPKCTEKYEEGLDVEELQNKIDKFYDSNEIKFEQVEYDQKKVNYFFARKALLEKEKLFEKRYSFKCSWCEYKKYCSSKGKDKSELVEEIEEIKLWEEK